MSEDCLRLLIEVGEHPQKQDMTFKQRNFSVQQRTTNGRHVSFHVEIIADIKKKMKVRKLVLQRPSILPCPKKPNLIL